LTTNGEATEYQEVMVFPGRLGCRRYQRKPEGDIIGYPRIRSGHSNDCGGRFVDEYSLADHWLTFVVTAFPDTVSQEDDGRRPGLRIRWFQIAPEQRFLVKDGEHVRRHSHNKVVLRKAGVIVNARK
jgi:hypothetical protein